MRIQKAESEYGKEGFMIKDRRVQASFTVEAALIMSMVLLMITSLILFCFSLHDKVLARNTLLYTLECYISREKRKNEEDSPKEIAQDEQQYFKDTPSSIQIEDDLTDLWPAASVSWKEESYRVTGYHLRLETVMRLMTVCDGLDQDVEAKKEEDANEDIREGNP